MNIDLVKTVCTLCATPRINGDFWRGQITWLRNNPIQVPCTKSWQFICDSCDIPHRHPDDSNGNEEYTSNVLRHTGRSATPSDYYWRFFQSVVSARIRGCSVTPLGPDKNDAPGLVLLVESLPLFQQPRLLVHSSAHLPSLRSYMYAIATHTYNRIQLYTCICIYEQQYADCEQVVTYRIWLQPEDRK